MLSDQRIRMIQFKNSIHILPALEYGFACLCLRILPADYRFHTYGNTHHSRNTPCYTFTLVIVTELLFLFMQWYGDYHINSLEEIRIQ